MLKNGSVSDRTILFYASRGASMAIEVFDESCGGPADFISLALMSGVLKIGNFKTKAGRSTPYFFNAGDFCNGESLSNASDFYADLLVKRFGSEVLEQCVLFGPAYKGIGLVHTISVALFEAYGLKVKCAYNRKEAKDHGESGSFVGASMKDMPVIIAEDVMSTGETKREAVKMITAQGGKIIGCVVGLDRLERGENPFLTGRQEFEELFGVPMYAIATTMDIIEALTWPQWGNTTQESIANIKAYLQEYGPVPGKPD